MNALNKDFSSPARAFGLILVFLLPLKFGSLVTISSITMGYRFDFFSILFSIWPAALFPVFCGVFLLLVLLTVPKKAEFSEGSFYAAGFLLLACVSSLGFLAGGNPFNYALQMMAYSSGLAMLAWGVALSAEHWGDSFRRDLAWAFSAGLFFSMCSGFYQYFFGYANLLNRIQEAYTQEGQLYNNMIVGRLREFRVTADFSACNAYAGYLILSLPILCGILWTSAKRFGTGLYTGIVFLLVLVTIVIFGNVESLIAAVLCGGAALSVLKLAPLRFSRFFMTFLFVFLGLVLLCLTGSRGGLLALATGTFLLLLSLNLSKKLRIFLFALIPAGGIAFAFFIALGRGGKSILFRLDYFQAAFRMMLNHPWIGEGWGGFQRNFLLLRMIADPESPNSPHSFLLSFASQTGVAGLVVSAFVLLFPLVCGWRVFRKISPGEAFSDEKIIGTLAFLGLLSWSVHSCMEVNLETAGSTALALSSAFLIPGFSDALKFRIPAGKHLKIFTCAGILVCGAFPVISALRYDYAFSRFNDLLERAHGFFMTEAAMNAYRECEKIQPRSPYHALALLNFLESSGAPADELLVLLDTAVSRNPENAALYDRKYRILRKAGMNREASEAREISRKLAPFDKRYFE